MTIIQRKISKLTMTLSILRDSSKFTIILSVMR